MISHFGERCQVRDALRFTLSTVRDIVTRPGSRMRLEELGITLPPAPEPVGLFSLATVHNGLVYVSGHAAMHEGKFVCGTLGADFTIEQGRDAARLATLGCLASMQATLRSLERVERVLKVLGFVRSTPEFRDHPTVMDGATTLIASVFGPCDPPARSAVGMTSLPRGTAVEVEIIAATRDE